MSLRAVGLRWLLGFLDLLGVEVAAALATRLVAAVVATAAVSLAISVVVSVKKALVAAVQTLAVVAQPAAQHQLSWLPSLCLQPRAA